VAKNRNKALDNRLVKEVLELEAGKFQMNAAEAHEFIKCLQIVLATNIITDPDVKLFTNFLVGIENAKVKIKKEK
jgi:hypothetical protein